jgi:hypothetical protein
VTQQPTKQTKGIYAMYSDTEESTTVQLLPDQPNPAPFATVEQLSELRNRLKAARVRYQARRVRYRNYLRRLTDDGQSAVTHAAVKEIQRESEDLTGCAEAYLAAADAFVRAMGFDAMANFLDSATSYLGSQMLDAAIAAADTL